MDSLSPLPPSVPWHMFSKWTTHDFQSTGMIPFPFGPGSLSAPYDLVNGITPFVDAVSSSAPFLPPMGFEMQQDHFPVYSQTPNTLPHPLRSDLSEIRYTQEGEHLSSSLATPRPAEGFSYHPNTVYHTSLTVGHSGAPPMPVHGYPSPLSSSIPARGGAARHTRQTREYNPYPKLGSLSGYKAAGGGVVEPLLLPPTERPIPLHELRYRQAPEWDMLPKFNLTEDGWYIPGHSLLLGLSLMADSTSEVGNLTFGLGSSRVYLASDSSMGVSKPHALETNLHEKARTIIRQHLQISAPVSRDNVGQNRMESLIGMVTTAVQTLLRTCSTDTILPEKVLEILLFTLAGTGHNKNITLKSTMTASAREWLNGHLDSTQLPVQTAREEFSDNVQRHISPEASTSSCPPPLIPHKGNCGSSRRNPTGDQPQQRGLGRAALVDRRFTKEDQPPLPDPTRPTAIVDESGWTLSQDPFILRMDFCFGERLSFVESSHEVLFQNQTANASIERAIPNEVEMPCITTPELHGLHRSQPEMFHSGVV
ncbi:hypothetical protein TREMEDRAFT_65002 [Tremella mesenterica DSM 1558]|uniref:uncharacterized protein n=1 Tax=Tremella mesenterica (strain ATCC 24925 / CBS 8224 / DSM 1558 / NBRC 9311 / NRRL Y-6157 / RJB 2259-6 / UBC 559-6) TaxID=578456 RepID=UPI0003F48D84|nr:uncharacterized protein TREMEDRAFT_65002 [Tremella mesenterica DSM 1558]EIW67133.1 hypothetical protein TREMEDRAFT_65002 [Tremella mesenterica DSM 1558]